MLKKTIIESAKKIKLLGNFGAFKLNINLNLIILVKNLKIRKNSRIRPIKKEKSTDSTVLENVKKNNKIDIFITDEAI
jgi:hypothetical protein